MSAKADADACLRVAEAAKQRALQAWREVWSEARHKPLAQQRIRDARLEDAIREYDVACRAVKAAKAAARQQQAAGGRDG